MGPLHAAITATMIERNNARIRRADASPANPRPLAGLDWDAQLRRRFPAISAEWRSFVAAGGRLPHLEQVLDEAQGNEGRWRAGLLIVGGRPSAALAGRFPAAVEALRQVPGLRYALWSVLEPGADLPEHTGPNAGILRYHLTIASNDQAALQVGTSVVPYVEGEAILFDDTAPHAAWNRGSSPRVSILCELLRPVPAPTSWCNRAVQGWLSLDRRYRLATTRAVEWDRALNPDLPVGPG
jgi:hypothetical protein